SANLFREEPGVLKGKTAYMSPEQARAKPLDRRSDIFSLGVCAWELITGQRLFYRKSELDMLRAVQMCDVPRLSSVRHDVPRRLEAAIDKALACEVDDRWDDAADLGHAILHWQTSAGLPPSKARLAQTMTRLFGADAAARRMRTTEESMEATAKRPALVEDAPPLPSPSGRLPAKEPQRMHFAAPIDATPQPLVLADYERRRHMLHPERWIPQIALHLPEPRLPRLRLLAVPALALLLSAGGLLFGLHSPHAQRALRVSLPTPAPRTTAAAAVAPSVATAPAAAAPAAPLVAASAAQAVASAAATPFAPRTTPAPTAPTAPAPALAAPAAATGQPALAAHRRATVKHRVRRQRRRRPGAV
ncbi:MAG TPA: protein kinase, partial [Polyangia bacterium]|nr:protein kinase [Polyangia bacterium]